MQMYASTVKAVSLYLHAKPYKRWHAVLLSAYDAVQHGIAHDVWAVEQAVYLRIWQAVQGAAAAFPAPRQGADTATRSTVPFAPAAKALQRAKRALIPS